MSKVFVILDAIPVSVDTEKVLTQLGYPRDAPLPPKLQEKVEAQKAETLRLINPKGAYLLLEGAGQKGFEMFWEAEGIVLALATIGPAVERRAKKLTNTEQSAAGLIADAVGTVAAELTADFLESKIRQDFAALGWKVSRRYAPGYCGWGLEGQKEIFNRFPDTIGIELTKSCLMIPEKSLSFVCMLSKKGNFDKIKLEDCKRCKQKYCPYRLHSYIIER
jgi:hypothetical protein